MKYLVVSDSHGDRDILEEIKKEWSGKVNHFFHNGDSELYSDDELWKTYTVVGGNMDTRSGYSPVQVTKIGGDVIFQTHGHIQGINYDFSQLYREAEVSGATICLYGHLHKISANLHNGILYVNPGSISLPRGEILEKAYAVIEATGDKFYVQYFDRSHQPLAQLQYTFNRTK
ncbi:MAG: metallophosphoesterase [Streptococcaceae bacterium]|jgi:putative phosphoesterase|nr:metallophosphoesterase [Streptococcaceae bacterium]